MTRIWPRPCRGRTVKASPLYLRRSDGLFLGRTAYCRSCRRWRGPPPLRGELPLAPCRSISRWTGSCRRQSKMTGVSVSVAAAASMDAGSPKRDLAGHDRDVWASPWRKVVARSEQLRKEAHPAIQDQDTDPPQVQRRSPGVRITGRRPWATAPSGYPGRWARNSPLLLPWSPERDRPQLKPGGRRLSVSRHRACP